VETLYPETIGALVVDDEEVINVNVPTGAYGVGWGYKGEIEAGSVARVPVIAWLKVVELEFSLASQGKFEFAVVLTTEVGSRLWGCKRH
jgi:hypothetical protein